MLFESEGNILDNEALINTLNDSKITSGTVKQRLEEAERTEIKITAAREKYRPVAARSSVLYFVVASMSLVDPMYEYSLKYYKEIFQMTVESSEKSNDLETRLGILMDECTAAVYKNVARGLFERHKISFSFLMCIEIEKLAGRVTIQDFDLVLRGISINPDKIYPERPKQVHSEELWKIICELEELANDDMKFQDLTKLVQKQAVFVSIGETRVLLNADKHASYISKSNDEYIDFNEQITEFQKLVMARLFAEEKLLACAVTYVEQTIGKQYILPAPSAIPSLYQDMNQNIPLVFILSAGSDPMAQFAKFATEKGYGERYHVISLGQGQGPIAARMIESGVRSGDWIFLQNCHLAKSWMPAMESIVKAFTDTTQKRAPNHPDFRLWLSSMPTVGFPTSVLQSAVKVTNEPPAGLRANLKRSIESIEPDFYEKHQLGVLWRRSIMGLSFFHAIIQERKRFGPLGWNIPYEFNDSDRDCGFLNFNIWSKEGSIPWDALLYITGNVTYGGRVTDSWDQRLLNTIMRRFIGDECLEPRYSFSSDGTYRAPGNANTVEELKEYIDNLPNEDSPEVFGMHPNAQLAAQKREVGLMLDTLAMVTPKAGGGGAESIQNQQVLDVLNQVKAKLGESITSDHPCESLFICDDTGRQNSLTVVLTQEIARFNNLLRLIHDCLNELEKAISGLVVMSEEIEAVYSAFNMFLKTKSCT